MAEDPAVREAVSEYVAAKAVQAADLDARIEDALPSDAKVLAPPLTRSLQRFLVDEIDRFLGTELAQRLWVDINRFAHEQLITALRDENRSDHRGRERRHARPPAPGRRGPAAARGQRSRDCSAATSRCPRSTPPPPRTTIQTLLQDALGRELPADFGSITLLRGEPGRTRPSRRSSCSTTS